MICNPYNRWCRDRNGTPCGGRYEVGLCVVVISCFMLRVLCLTLTLILINQHPSMYLPQCPTFIHSSLTKAVPPRPRTSSHHHKTKNKMSLPSSPSGTPSSPSIHIHPHSAHLGQSPSSGSTATATSTALEEEEHEYEALPVGHGWATNMAAGAMAGISEHAAIFPVDSIKVSLESECDVEMK